MRLPPGLFWTLTDCPFVLFSVGWPGKAELTLSGCFRPAGGKTLVLQGVGKENLFTVADVCSFPRSKLDTYFSRVQDYLPAASARKLALGDPGHPWLFLFHKEIIYIESRSFRSDLRKPSKVS